METLTSERVKLAAPDTFDIQHVFERSLIEAELQKVLGTAEQGLGEMAGHLLAAGGKRMRPLLVLNCGLQFDGPMPELLAAAVAVELIHMASLIHDDIIDGAPMRRNRPSVNQLWGNHRAVLVGNYLFAKAVGILSKNRLLECLDRMAEAIQNMVSGEIRQAEGRFDMNTSISGYYERISKKTAVLIKNCCESGAIIAKAPPGQIENLGEYGLQIGLAFQIVDDILDFTGNPADTGKPKWEDVINGNITLPLILLLGDPDYGPRIRQNLAQKEIDDKICIEVTGILYQSGVIAQCYQIARSHIQKAKEILERLAQSPRLNFLLDLADKVESRIK